MIRPIILCFTLMIANVWGIEEVKTYYFNVVLEARHQTVVFSQVTAPVLSVLKKMGDGFEEGELIVDLDNRIYEGNFKKTDAAVTKFQTELKAKEQLYKDDALSQFELDEAISSLAGAEADRIIAKKMLDDTKIVAPYKGRVVKVNVKEFELAQQNKELVTLVDDAYLYAKFLVPSTHLRCLEPGAPVEIFVRETNQKIAATISRIAPVIDPSSQTLLVEAGIDNGDHKLLAGMTGKVALKECQGVSP
jgi:membrane fusion protein (multidrug efflux system)